MDWERINTNASYCLRCCIAVQAILLGSDYFFHHEGGTAFAEFQINLFRVVGLGTLLASLIDIFTPSDPQRRLSKAIDIASTAVWGLGYGAMFVWAIRQGV